MKLRSGLSRTLGTLLAPLCTLALFLYTAKKPKHVLEFPDPDFSFLFSSLGLLHGEPPRHVEYPGTPLQLLGVPVMALRYLFAGTAPSIAEDFFAHPVEYQQVLLAVLVSLFLGAQVFCGRRLLELGVPLSLAIFAQLGPFFVWDGVVYLGHSSPEILLAATSLCLLPFLVEPGKAETGARSTSPGLAAGMLIALMVALKASSAPLLALLFLLPRGRQRLQATAAFTVFLLGVTAPAWPNLPRLFRGVVAQQSAAVERSFVTIATNASDPDLVLRAAPLLLAAWFLFLLRFLQRREPAGRSTMPLILAGAMIAFLVARSPASRHFLVLVPVVVLAVIHLCRHSSLHRALLLATVCLGVGVAFPNRLAAQVSIRTRAAEGITALEGLLGGKYADCHVTVLDDAFVPAFTLYTGARAVPRGYFADELTRLYPRYSFVRAGQSTLRSFRGLLTDPAWAALALQRPCLVIVGKTRTVEEHFRETFRAEPVHLETTGEPPYHSVLALSPPTEARYRALLGGQGKGRVPRRSSP